MHSGPGYGTIHKTQTRHTKLSGRVITRRESTARTWWVSLGRGVDERVCEAAALPLSRLRVTSLRCARFWSTTFRRWDERDAVFCSLARTVRLCMAKRERERLKGRLKKRGLCQEGRTDCGAGQPKRPWSNSSSSFTSSSSSDRNIPSRRSRPCHRIPTTTSGSSWQVGEPQ